MVKRNEVEIPVRDRSADRWIRIIALVALFTFPLVGMIGTLILGNMDKMAVRQSMTIDALNAIRVNIGSYGSRISRAEKDITEINVMVDKHSQRIYKLEGKR